MRSLKIFVVDDEDILRVSISDDLRDAGYKVFEFDDPRLALNSLGQIEPDIVFTDIKMPEIDGLELLKRIKTINPEITVVVMTAFGSINSAVEAMKLGAYDYLTKPFQTDELLLLLDRIKQFRFVKNDYDTITSEFKSQYDFSSAVSESPAMKEVLELVKRVSNSSTSVLITGETGSGKEFLTNIIHYNSVRRNKPLIKVSCAVLSREVFESELFGHEKGAFTGADKTKKGRFELAEGGTLFLDDVDDIPLSLQVKLLRVLQEQEFERVGGTDTLKVDVRVITSTKEDLKTLVKEKRFREDLFYRLNVFPIHMRPLRERIEDIKGLVTFYVDKFSNGKTIQIDDDVYEVLQKYHWPGNIRELKNLIERLILVCTDDKITVSKLPIEFYMQEIHDRSVTVGSLSLDQMLADYEIGILKAALKKCKGNKAKSAELLGIPPSTLRSKLEKYNIE